MFVFDQTKITLWGAFQRDDGKEYEYNEVVQKPISPAYKEILEKTKNISLKHQGFYVKDGEEN